MTHWPLPNPVKERALRVGTEVTAETALSGGHGQWLIN